jgi:DNA-binding NarL/FixJ family response regulator
VHSWPVSATGFRNREIGGLFLVRSMRRSFFISEQAVKNRLHNIFDKLGVSGRLELALYAIHHRLIDQTKFA